MSNSPCVRLNTGVQMPLVGLGTYKLVGPENVFKAIDAALTAGYRAFDSAAVYRNEADLGKALKELLPKHGLTREDVFITSKLGPKDQGANAMEGALHSLSELDLGYIDLYLIHWPGTQGLGVTDKRNPGCSYSFYKHYTSLNESVVMHTMMIDSPHQPAASHHGQLQSSGESSLSQEVGFQSRSFPLR